MEALAKSEAEGGDSLHTATLAENLATTLRDLASDAVPGPEKRTLTVEALARTRDLAARVGDDVQPRTLAWQCPSKPLGMEFQIALSYASLG